ncbi:LysR family transcriptional regulator [Bordetella hinzii]|nr:LysR family transcriptional regulator [Bordetella hinzii]QDJ39833.1 LysR family transcriptional regulator [Bordetella hinzii]QDJ44353.1 LysR family transcriptional regulator [Bordetella hinzii]QDJ53364.1 LysR family transcriptional regulator [Bordetella hinzii]WPL80000.1 LysR family transcriptional regulator [Bordetella hinzii]
MRINYDIEDLRAFCCLVRCGQYTAAAEVLCITPSALSRRIAKLESEIGGKLFERTTRRLQVAPLGVMLYERVLPAISQLDASVAEAARAAQGDGRTLKLGAVASVGYSVLPKVLPALYAEYPGVFVSIRDSHATVVTQLVEQGEVEFAVTTSVSFPQSLNVHKLGTYDYNLVYRDTGALASLPAELSWQDLCSLPVVGLHPLSSTRLQIDSVLHANAIPRPWKLEVDQLATMLSLVRNGAFVAVMPTLFDVRDQGLSVARIKQPDITRDFYIVHRTDISLSSPARCLVGLIRDHCDLISRGAPTTDRP